MQSKKTRMFRGRHGKMRQRGVAVVTALLLTTLSITIVSSLFWQQHVQVRSIENQQLQLQKQWILRGALDWARLILGQDANGSSVDHLGESWAAPLVAAELESHLDKEGGRIANAILSGSIVDAQSRYNLSNLVADNAVNLREVAAFRRLLTSLKLDPQLAQRTAELVAAGYGGSAAAADTTAGRGAITARPLRIQGTEDLLAIAGVTPAVLDKLRDFVVVLPQSTPVNVNTASPQVLAAKMEGMTAEEAAALVVGRDRAYIRDEGDLSLRLQGKFAESLNKDISLSTNYFLVNANVRLNKGSLKIQALLTRNLMTGSKLIWIREY